MRPGQSQMPRRPVGEANASSKQQKRNQGVTEIVEVPGCGHALTIDSGWREVADKALAFVKRFVS
jgi:non-heme chloroperoxidase